MDWVDDPTALKVHFVHVVDGAVPMEYEEAHMAEFEANLAQKKISVDSPIGKGLLGKSVGDVTEVTVPAGVIPFEILEITR